MQGSQKKNLSGNFMVAVDANQADIFGLSCLINTCYDEIKHTIVLVKQRIQRNQDLSYSLMEEGLMEG
jgi:hypothetical protein